MHRFLLAPDFMQVPLTLLAKPALLPPLASHHGLLPAELVQPLSRDALLTTLALLAPLAPHHGLLPMEMVRPEGLRVGYASTK